MRTSSAPAGLLMRLWHQGLRVFAGLVLFFLVAPILVLVPLSFNAEPYFSFTPGMLALEADAWSLRWYREVLDNPQWTLAVRNSFLVGVLAAPIATALSTLAALGLVRPEMPWRSTITAVLISPMIVPIIITGTGIYFYFALSGLTQSLIGIVLAHVVLGTPFVVLTVTATLSGFDHSLVRAAANLGATPAVTLRRVIIPLILPGVVSGALFAFITSFDEVVVVLFLAGYDQRTIPMQMWSGIRDQISPAIFAVASMLIAVSVLLMIALEILRRRNERLRGISEA